MKKIFIVMILVASLAGAGSSQASDIKKLDCEVANAFVHLVAQELGYIGGFRQIEDVQMGVVMGANGFAQVRTVINAIMLEYRGVVMQEAWQHYPDGSLKAIISAGDKLILLEFMPELRNMLVIATVLGG